MGHTKDSMLEEMRLKGGAMMATMLEEDVSIKVDQLHVPEDATDLRADFIRPAHHWLVQVYAKQYAEVRRIKKMQPDEMWARYKNWGGFEEYREVLLLKDALSTLRSTIVSRKRPDFYKKSKRNAKQNKTKAAQAKSGVPETESVEG